jgi:hypothetical protein
MIRPSGGQGSSHIKIIALVFCLVAEVLVWTVSCRSTTNGGLTEQASSVIDAPAADQVAPPDAVVNVKTVYGAAGDGHTDDTAAIQAAISSGLGFGNRNKILYFPAGTYLVIKPLEWRLASGSWSTWLTLMGENRDRTVIKLVDSASGFADPSVPRAVVVTGSQNANPLNGSGNQAFDNFIFDLTIDVGAGNPGADGIDFLANNRGAIRNVVVRAAPNSGHTGISMNRRWPGPALLEDVRVDGFAQGISISNLEYSMTAENIRLSGQRVVGVENQNNVLSMRRLVSRNAVPAVRNGQPGFTAGLLTLIDSDLSGGLPGVAAVENNGGAFLRDVHTVGYSFPVRDQGIDRHLPDGAEWSSANPSTLFRTSASSLRIPIAEDPVPPLYPAGQWAGVDSFGARSGDKGDDTAAIQAALDSGKPVVYLRSGLYIVSRTLQIPKTVRAIVGFEALIDATRGGFAGSSTAAVLSVHDASPDPLVISQLALETSPQAVDIERLAPHPVALRDIHFVGVKGLPFRGSPGPLFLTNVEGGGGWHFTAGQQIWARQLNAEQTGTKILNDGADLWILGFKTEAPSTAIKSMGGARTEILGGLLYPVKATTDGMPAFSSLDATQSLTVATSAYDQTRNYHTLVDATRNSVHQQLTSDNVPHRGAGSMITLYSDAP